MKLKGTWVLILAGVVGVSALAAARRSCPDGQCAISSTLGMLTGPAGCSPARESAADAAATIASASTSTPAPTSNSDSAPSPHATAMTTQPSTPASTAAPATPAKTEQAMFGAGCFWGVEATFRKLPGVIEVYSGYTGGRTKNPTYKDVCADTTGHAEVVHITFDPAQVSYQKLVETFFKMHDPTQVNRQGPDYGTQYRSAIFFYSPEQQKTAQGVKDALTAKGKYKRPIATEISPAGPFYKAEDYHQRYLEKNGLDNCHLPPADDE